MNNQNQTLTLLYTPTGSLSKLEQVGLLDRELKYIRSVASDYDRVFVVDPYYAPAVVGRLPSQVEYRAFRHTKYLSLFAFLLLSPLIWREAFSHGQPIRARFVSGGLPAVIAKALYGAPYAVGYQWSWSGFAKDHGRRLSAWLKRVYEDMIMRGADLVFPSTGALDETVKRRHPDASTVVLPNFVDTEQFSPRSSTSNNGARQTHLVTVGRLHKDKNYALLLEALRLVRFPYHLTIIGQGPLEQEILDRGTSLGTNFDLLERVPHAEMPRFLHQADIFVLTSRHEGHPKALIEAMSCELPCVATDVEGSRDVIDHGRTGFLCEEVPDAIASVLNELAGDVTLRRRVGKAARQKIVEECSIEAVVSSELAALRRLGSVT